VKKAKLRKAKDFMKTHTAIPGGGTLHKRSRAAEIVARGAHHAGGFDSRVKLYI
jgi:hypothetical protein